MISQLVTCDIYLGLLACGQTTNLNELWQLIKDISGSKVNANHGPNRKGDIFFSLADISKAKEILGYNADSDIKEWLRTILKWYKEKPQKG